MRKAIITCGFGVPVLVLTLMSLVYSAGSLGILVGISGPGSAATWCVFSFCLALGGWFGTGPDFMVSHRIPWALYTSSMS